MSIETRKPFRLNCVSLCTHDVGRMTRQLEVFVNWSPSRSVLFHPKIA